jgi:hypothetical protein
LVVVADGAKYRISIKSTMGAEAAKIGAEGGAEEYGSDGVDTFLVTDRSTALSSEAHVSGIIYSGRFPTYSSILAQTAWLGYCSDGYFEDPTTHTNLCLSEVLAWTPPDGVTNLVAYWPNSMSPREITGWSKNWVTLPGMEQAAELKQYPSGFKAWKFTASDDVSVGKVRLPHKLQLEGFVPRPPKDATSGDETTLIRSVTFVADSMEVETNGFDPLPPVPVANMPVNDKRFVKETSRLLLVAHVSPSGGWPTRTTEQFKRLAQQAHEMGVAQMRNVPKPKRAIIWIFAICGINLVILVMLIRAISSRKSKNSTLK